MRQPPYPHIARLTSKFQLTIPKRMLEYYGLRPGDKVVLWVKGRRLFVQPYRGGELAGAGQQPQEQKHARW